MIRAILAALVFCFIAGCSTKCPPCPPITVGQTVNAKHGVVVSVSPIASRIGCDVLRQGGNAVDASVATAFALAVVWPEAGNIGGGGFMMVQGPEGKTQASTRSVLGNPLPTFIDYRETAPAAVKADTFSNKPSSYLLAGTPGTVRGLHRAYQELGSGKIGWGQLLAPAIKLAQDGFTVDAALAASLNSGLRNSENFPEFRRVYGKPDGTAWRAGDELKLPDLAETLKAIALEGPDGFYGGHVAALIVEEMQRGGGFITREDLAAYKAQRRTPITGYFRGYKILAPPPPSSGGVALLQILGMLDTFQLKPADRWSARSMHLIVESMRRAFAERAHWLGDPDFGDVPVEKLLEPQHIRELARSIDPAKASTSESVAPWVELKEVGGQTTHFSVIDADGMAVSNTYTLEQSFGGKIVVRGAGFLLNNELGDFNPIPDVTTRTGKIGTPPNQAAPRKRPLSSMTPTIVTRNGEVVLVAGSPGGRTIINTVTQVVMNRLMFDMPLRAAVDAPRIHEQWFPDAIRAEKSLAQQHPELIRELKAMGHHVDPNFVSRQGDAHSIEVNPKTGEKTGVADKRIGGAAAGY